MGQIIWMKIPILPIMTCHETQQFHSMAIVIGLKIIGLHLKSNEIVNRINASVLHKI